MSVTVTPEPSTIATQPGAVTGPIVVGLDDSETSVRAGAYAVEMARRSGSRVVFVRVVNTAALVGFAVGALPALQESAAEDAVETRARLATTLDGSGVSWELQEFVGNPYVELTAVAESMAADLVVVGASMHAGHRLIGSLPAHLVRNHRWPVLVVP